MIFEFICDIAMLKKIVKTQLFSLKELSPCQSLEFSQVLGFFKYCFISTCLWTLNTLNTIMMVWYV